MCDIGLGHGISAEKRIRNLQHRTAITLINMPILVSRIYRLLLFFHVDLLSIFRRKKVIREAWYNGHMKDCINVDISGRVSSHLTWYIYTLLELASK